MTNSRRGRRSCSLREPQPQHGAPDLLRSSIESATGEGPSVTDTNSAIDEELVTVKKELTDARKELSDVKDAYEMQNMIIPDLEEMRYE